MLLNRQQDEAVRLLLEPYRGRALKATRSCLAALTLDYLGTLHVRRREFADAFVLYLEAKSRAENCPSKKIPVLQNLSSLYLHYSAFDEALAAAEQIDAVPYQYDGAPWFGILLHRARLLNHVGQPGRAESLFEEAFALADSIRRPDLVAFGLSVLGKARQDRGDLDGAEDAFSRSFAWRSLNGSSALSTSRHYLAELRLAQNRPRDAIHLASNMISDLGPGAGWASYHTRAKGYLALGEIEPALDDLRQASSLLRNRPLDELPADALRVSASSWPHEVHALLVEAGNRHYQQTGDASLLRETLQAAERVRASSLRLATKRVLGRSNQETLARLQNAYEKMYGSPTTTARREIDRIRLELVELEAAEARQDSPSREDPRQPWVGDRLGVDEALIVFQTGASNSWRWTVTRDSLELATLPGTSQLNDLAAAAIREVQGATARTAASEAAYTGVFGGLSPAVRARSRWLLVLDGPLFRLPLPALKEGRHYLGEQRVLEIVSGSWSLNTPPQRGWDGPFLAVDDPIYNRADPRWKPPPSNWLRLFPFAQASLGLELSRLPSSRQEVDACARNWNAERAIILTGDQARALPLAEGLSADPSVIHFATHFVPSPHDPMENLVALSISPSGTPEYLGPEIISRWTAKARLVVMSGCRSASGSVHAGEGLMGLTRAWLAAGAASVLATHWPVADQAGGILPDFYDALRKTRDPAYALHRAQTAAIRRPGSPSPSQWAAWYLVSARRP